MWRKEKETKECTGVWTTLATGALYQKPPLKWSSSKHSSNHCIIQLMCLDLEKLVALASHRLWAHFLVKKEQ